MVSINVELKGVRALERKMTGISRQIPFATALALTRTAQIVRDAIRSDIGRVFDRPTQWTLNSLRVEAARKTNLVAKVSIKDIAGRGTPALEWLKPEVEGGQRKSKPSERRLKADSALPTNRQTAIGANAKTNKHGNLTRKRVADAMEGAKKTLSGDTKKQKYFLMKRGKTPIAIAQRTSKRSMHIVLAFVSVPNYSKKLDFYGVGQRAANAALPKEIQKAIEHAIKTARK